MQQLISYYYRLLDRAVVGLTSDSSDVRHGLYESARNVVEGSHDRIAMEEAIQRVEQVTASRPILRRRAITHEDLKRIRVKAATSTLIHIQFPIVDFRHFVSGYNIDRLLRVPDWMLPGPHEEFVRSFGTMTYPPDDEVWPSAQRRPPYCDARRAVRFDVHAFDDAKLREYKPEIVFRRLSIEVIAPTRDLDIPMDMPVVIKFDVAVSVIPELDKLGIDDLLDRLLSMRVRVGRPHHNPKICCLHEAGDYLAKLYMHATTKRVNSTTSFSPHFQPFRRQADRSPTRLVTAGTPAIFMDVPVTQLAPEALPPLAKPINLYAKDEKLYRWSITYGKRKVPVWTLLRPAHTRERANNFRLSLLRANAENQTIIRVMQGIRHGYIKPQPKTPALIFLEVFIQDAAKKLKSHLTKKKLKIDDPDVLDVIAASDDFFSADDAEILLNRIESLKFKDSVEEAAKIIVQRRIRDIDTPNRGLQYLCLLFLFGVVVINPSLNAPWDDVIRAVCGVFAALAWLSITAGSGGQLSIRMRWGKTVLRATGAPALFVIVFFKQELLSTGSKFLEFFRSILGG